MQAVFIRNLHIFNTFRYLWSHLGLNQGPPDYESGTKSVKSRAREVSDMQCYNFVTILLYIYAFFYSFYILADGEFIDIIVTRRII